MTGRLSQRVRVEFLAAFSLSCGALGLILAPLLSSMPVAYFSACLVGIGHGISLPTLLVLVGRAVPSDQRGLALGLRSSVNQAAAAVAPPVIAVVVGATAFSVGFPLAGAVGLLLIGSAVATIQDEPPGF